ncbi:RelA/SpoT family protein [Candidatus Nomurabacteria bacterium]|nr:RelA/SpoT family protein [Candidatus Nomurabacteria bacterium]
MPHPTEITSLVEGLSEKDIKLIEKAYNFAQIAHEGQLRGSGEPYFNHVFETAKILAELGMDTKTIVAGLLHDVLEDTQTPEETLKKEFGEEIVMLVNGVTKLGKMKYTGAERHVESLRKFFMAMANDLRVLIIKLADRLHNVRTLQYVKPEKQRRIALETIEIHARLADYIGMGKLKGELEDAAFPYAYPEAYLQVEKLLAENSNSNKEQLEIVSKELTNELKEQGVNVIEISTRAKHKYSLWIKINKHDMDISKVYDLVALRIIVKDIEKCYQTLGIIHGLFKPVPGRIKDYIATPKKNGYRSLHTTIFTGNGGIIEVQIRTPEMHAEAAYGVAAHFVYKDQKKQAVTFNPNQKIEWMDKLKEIHKIIDKPDKFLEHLKMDLFNDRIFIFTPQGDVIDLPVDSSAIDFAYSIHSDIGNHTQAVTINHKMVPLHTKLKNNDIVEIITNKNANPSSKWLEYTKTTMAKKHINAYLKENSLLSKFRSFAKF